MSNIFLVKLITGSLSAENLWTLIKSKFNIDDGRTRIVEILNSNGYKYRSPKLKINYNTIILNWSKSKNLSLFHKFFHNELTFI